MTQVFAVRVRYNGQTRKSATILVRNQSFVRFAILEACNALRVPYDKRFGFFRLHHGEHYPWVHPNAKFPLIKQTKRDVFEIKICNNPQYWSNLDVIRIMVENIDDRYAPTVMVQMSTTTQCYMIPVMYRKLSRQAIEQPHLWSSIIKGNMLLDADARLSEYEINDGDTVQICRDVLLDTSENSYEDDPDAELSDTYESYEEYYDPCRVQ